MRALSVLEPALEAVRVTRKFWLIWKHHETRRYHRIGQFDHLADGHYVFRYLPESANVAGFSPLLQFPEPDKIYVAAALPAFLSNRIMSPRRENYDEYLGWLGLDKNDPMVPVEILARTGGVRVTDTFHLVERFDEYAGLPMGRFFISGVRHRDHEAALGLSPGQQLQLKDEPDNSYNPRAILLAADGTEIGWVPDWLVDELHVLRERHELRVFVERVNPDSPARLAVLCRFEAHSRQGLPT